MSFDAVLSFDIPPREGLKLLYDTITKEYPDYGVFITPDVDVTD